MVKFSRQSMLTASENIIYNVELIFDTLFTFSQCRLDKGLTSENLVEEFGLVEDNSSISEFGRLQ